MLNKTVFHWSSGKDSALALYHLKNSSKVEVNHLVTTINKHHQRVTMHGTPVHLLEQQLIATQLPYSLIELPESPSMSEYESLLSKHMRNLQKEGISHSAFGDIFLEDLKVYREKEMQKIGMECHFPIWQRNTKDLIAEFIDLGFRAKIVCCNDVMGSDFLGCEVNADFIKDLPKEIDPCGENGEFHTFCYDGPIFSKPVSFKLGKKIKRAYPDPKGEGNVNFWFIDLLDR